MLDYYLFFPHICLYHFNVCLLFYQKPKDKTKDYQKKKKKDLKNKEREDVLAFAYVRVCVCFYVHGMLTPYCIVSRAGQCSEQWLL